MSEELIQGSDEWKLARCGSLGASRVADAIARTKTGFGASRANLLAELLVERLTGIPTEGYQNDAMRWGTEKEPDARAAYEFRMNVDVVQVGIIKHPTIEGSHASPDGLVGNDGLLEVKCPSSATHIETLLGRTVPAKYTTQMMWQMACTGRRWVDFVSFDPRMPEDMRLFIMRIARDQVMIDQLEDMVGKFLLELDSNISRLLSLYRRAA